MYLQTYIEQFLHRDTHTKSHTHTVRKASTLTHVAHLDTVAMSKLNKGVLGFAKVSPPSFLLPPHVELHRGDGTTVVAVEELLQREGEGREGEEGEGRGRKGRGGKERGGRGGKGREGKGRGGEGRKGRGNEEKGGEGEGRAGGEGRGMGDQERHCEKIHHYIAGYNVTSNAQIRT